MSTVRMQIGNACMGQEPYLIQASLCTASMPIDMGNHDCRLVQNWLNRSSLKLPNPTPSTHELPRQGLPPIKKNAPSDSEIGQSMKQELNWPRYQLDFGRQRPIKHGARLQPIAWQFIKLDSQVLSSSEQ